MQSGVQDLGISIPRIVARARAGVTKADVAKFEDSELSNKLGRCFAYSTDQSVIGGTELKVLFTPTMGTSDVEAVYRYLDAQNLFSMVKKLH